MSRYAICRIRGGDEHSSIMTGITQFARFSLSKKAKSWFISNMHQGLLTNALLKTNIIVQLLLIAQSTWMTQFRGIIIFTQIFEYSSNRSICMFCYMYIVNVFKDTTLYENDESVSFPLRYILEGMKQVQQLTHDLHIFIYGWFV